MNCLEIKKNLAMYQENALNPIENEVVKEHLSTCAVCQQALKALEQSWELLGEIKDIEPQPNYISRFWTEVSLRKTWRQRILETLHPAFVNRKLAPVFAAACLAFAVSVIVFHNYKIQQSEQIVASLNEEDLEIVENIELAENIDMIEDLDIIQDMEVIEQLDRLEADRS